MFRFAFRLSLALAATAAALAAALASGPADAAYPGPNGRIVFQQGGSDRDYNDIRIVIGCPTVKASGTEKVALIK